MIEMGNNDVSLGEPPANYGTITPYLLIHEADGLVSFIKKVFGAKERMILKRDNGAIAHAELVVGNSVIMIGQPESRKDQFPGMLHVYVKDVDAIYQGALQAGAKSIKEPTNEEEGARRSGVADIYGNQWWISSQIEQLTPEEMKKRTGTH